MIERFLSALNAIQDNAWAFALFVLAAVVALSGGVLGAILILRFHVSDYTLAKDIIQFAGTIAMTGAAIFHGKDKRD